MTRNRRGPGLLMLRRGHNHAIRFCGNGKDQICFNCAIVGWKFGLLQKTGANFCERFLRSNILLTNNKENAIHRSKSVFKHESLQLAIVGCAPEFAFQKRPADFYFTIR